MKVKYVQLENNAFLMRIGYYDYEADAAITYDDEAIKLFGEFAYLNIRCRPEIKEWLEQTFFFPPMKNDPAGFAQTGPESDAIPIGAMSHPMEMSDSFL